MARKHLTVSHQPTDPLLVELFALLMGHPELKKRKKKQFVGNEN